MTHTRTEPRTATDPEDYVRRMNETYAGRYTFRVASIDGETKSGRKRYTLEITEYGFDAAERADKAERADQDAALAEWDRLMGTDR